MPENRLTSFSQEQFNRLPEEEKDDRISQLGEQGAIEQYSFELAQKSMDQIEAELSPEDQEEFEKLKLGAKNVIAAFQLKRSADNQKGENLLVVSDSGADELMLRALLEAGKEVAGADCRVVVAPKTEHAAQNFGQAIGERMKTADAILLITSLSRTHSQESAELFHPHFNTEVLAAHLSSPTLKDTFPILNEKYTSAEVAELLSSRKLSPDAMFPSKARLISITNTRREILTEGAALEDPQEMVEKIDRFAEIMKGVERVKITSENGTDLELDIKVNTLIKENGVVDKPGQGSNFPTGEYGGAVDLPGTNGIYVCDGAVGMIGKVDEPIKIFIQDGNAVNIEGGQSAQKLKMILEKANQDYQTTHPDDSTTNALRLAEFSFGMNSKAFRYDEQGNKISPETSLEGEKGLGTVHIALGKNTIFSLEADDPDANNIPVHIDLVAMKPTVIGIKDTGEEVHLINKGEITV